MPYAFMDDLPATAEIYTAIAREVGEELSPALLVHLAFQTEKGVRVVDVWETEKDFDRFNEERLRPAVERVLQQAGTSREQLGEPEHQDLRLIHLEGKGLPTIRPS